MIEGKCKLSNDYMSVIHDRKYKQLFVLNRGGGSCLALVPQATGADLGICVREGGTPPAQQGGMGERCSSPIRSQRFLRSNKLRKLYKKATARRPLK